MYVRPRPRFRPRNAGSGNTPSLALEFNQLSTLPSYVTFSRGTQAMQYGSDGTLQYAPNNLLTYSNQADNAAWTKSNSFVQTNLQTYSQDFDNAAWAKTTSGTGSTPAVTPNVFTAPDGTLTSDLITLNLNGGNTLTDQSILTGTTGTTTTGAPYAGSIYVIAATAADVGKILAFRHAGAATYSLITLTAAWQRFSVNETAAGIASSINVGLRGGTGASTGAVSFYAWGAQLVQGSVPGDYRATTSAALPVLYADYNGALRARKLCEDSVLTTHEAKQDVATLATQYTFSAYVKAGERTFAMLYHGNSNSAQVIDLTTGAAAGNAGLGAPLAYSITNLSNGWYRVAITVIATAAANNFRVYPLTNATTYNYTGNGSSGIYIADAQLTPGYLPLAVTETTSAAVYGPRFDYDPSSLVTQNLLLYSQAFENAVWGAFDVSHIVSANSAVAPDGTLTADAWTWPASTTNYGYGAQTITGDASQAYTYSVWARLQTGAKNVRLKISNVTVATLTSANIGLTTTWQRISYSIAAGALARTTQVGVAFELGSSSSVAAGDIIELWGAQLNQGSTALPYTATTTAPYTLTTARGLLIEEQRVNLLTFSNDFTNVIWSNVNVTVTPASTTSPEGVVNMSKLAATAGAATTLYQQSIVTATSASGSIYVKQGTGTTTANYFALRNVTTALDLVSGTLNYSTGVFTYTVGSTGVVIRNIGNGIWRVEISAAAGITPGDTVRLYTGFSGGAQTAGDFLYAYGAQLEAGAFATSYIPTVGSTATRNADSASITTLTPWYNTAAGTWYAAFQTTWDGNADQARAVIIGENASKRYLYIGVSQSAINSYDGVSILNPASGDVTGTAAKVASTYNATARTITNNAVAVASGTIAAGYSTPSLIQIGNLSSGNHLCGWINSVRYYPTALPNASLQSITV